jgi:predicted small secreted protein
MKTSMMRTAFAVLAAMTMAGCAGNTAGDGRDGDEQPQEVLRVLVQNNGTIPTHVRVSLVPEAGGAAARIGTMSTLGEETLTARLPEINGTYRLRAEGGTGSVLHSPPVSLRGNETIIWDMRLNAVRQANQ